MRTSYVGPVSHAGDDAIDRAPSGRAVSAPELEKNLRIVASSIADGRVVPFLGAGANTVSRPTDASWAPGRYLPTSVELSAALAVKFDYPVGEVADLPRVAQYIALTHGSSLVHSELHSIFAAEYQITPLHEFLAALPTMLRTRGSAFSYPVILTANYDDSLERAFEAAGEPYDLRSARPPANTWVPSGIGRQAEARC